jgi:hypothetical protein
MLQGARVRSALVIAPPQLESFHSVMKKPATDFSARVLRIFRWCHFAGVLPDVSNLSLVEKTLERNPKTREALLRRDHPLAKKELNDFRARSTVHGVVFRFRL